MHKIKKFFKTLGPGFITGASDDDPSGIGTYSQTGAQFGYNQLWTAPFSFPFMTVVQEICGRIGLVTGKGLSGIIRKNYPRPILYASVFLLFASNTLNIGADLGAMASSAQLLINFPFYFWLLIIVVIGIYLELFVPYERYVKYLKYLAFALLSYIAALILIKQNWLQVGIDTVFPKIKFSESYLMNLVAILGTTISPYLFFWESDQVVEDEVVHHKLRMFGQGVPRIRKADIKNLRIDTFFGMFFSNFVMFCIILTTASTLHANGITEVATAHDAAIALKPIAGNLAFFLFAAGVIGTGFLAIPVLSGSASYAIGEAFGWKVGFNQKLRKTIKFHVVILATILIGVVINVANIPPFKLLYYTAVFNGIVAPPLMVIIMFISKNKSIMGEHTNSRFSNTLGWMITAIMTIASVALIATFIF